MYRAVYTYKGEQDHILSFSAGDQLCVLEKKNDTWWLASTNAGKVGYVPKSYIRQEEGSSDVVLRSVNNAIEDLVASSPDGNYTLQQEALLRKLLSHKESIVANSKWQSSTKRRAPPPPPPDEEQSSSGVKKRDESKVKEHGPPLPARSSSLQRKDNVPEMNLNKSSKLHENVHEIPDELGVDLIKIMQDSLAISEAKSRDTVKMVLQTIQMQIPTLERVMTGIINTFPEKDKNEEACNLALALANLKEIKDDAQQRNWAIEDDEEKILQILDEILTEINSINKQCSMDLLSQEQHEALHTLVDYHQMETRVSLRLIILQIFGVICSLSKSFVSALLATVLPLELAMDIMNHTQDTQRTGYSALVMTMLFSTSEPVPFGHYVKLNKTFVEFLIKYIEDGMEEIEQDDQVTEMFLHLLLSFNLHFVVPDDNFVMQAISDHGTCTSLSEKMMMLVNRGDDPVLMQEHWINDDKGQQPPPSFLKFLQDIYSRHSTSSFLYTNDMMVLLDIITRNLSDLSSGDKLRTEYLDLLLNILKNTNYMEKRHRAVDIGQSLHRILREEDPESAAGQQSLEFDKKIVETILNDFGHLFN